MAPDRDEKIGRFIAYVLRHAPESEGLELDSGGWADASELAGAISRKFGSFGQSDLERIVSADEKQRYSLKQGRIRANQGHSIKAQAVNPSPKTPPEFLYHGTTEGGWREIQSSGRISKMGRNHVHLSLDVETALNVARRRKNSLPVVLQIRALELSATGHSFFLSDNGIWLSDEIPLASLTRVFDEDS